MEQSLIYKKLSEAIKYFGYAGVGKDSINSQQNFAYRSINSTLQVANSVFAKIGLSCTINSTDENLQIDRNQKQPYLLTAKVTLTVYAEDGSFLSSSSLFGQAGNDISKVGGMLTSYALKELLFKMFLIPTEAIEIDPDSLFEGLEEDAKATAKEYLEKPYLQWKNINDALNWAIRQGITEADFNKIVEIATPDDRNSKKLSIFELCNKMIQK